jgi:hypothetical protein
MDNAYLHGFDYDSHRSHSDRFDGRNFDLIYPTERRGKGVRIILLTMVIIPVLLLGMFSLRFIPLFDIESVAFNIAGGFDDIPIGVRKATESLLGTSSMTRALARFERDLSAMPLVGDVEVKRRGFSSIKVDIEMTVPPAFVAITDGTGDSGNMYLVDGKRLVAVEDGDFAIFGQKSLVVEVNASYGSHMLSYGIDHGLEKAIALASTMGMDEKGRYRVIGRIAYVESPGEDFGHMELDLPAYNSILNVREPVSESRLHDALRLIKLEHEQDWTRNIALIGQLRYDLYVQSLVVRR